MPTTFAEALAPIAKRLPRQVRTVEILRVAAQIHGDNFPSAAEAAREQALVWAKGRAGGDLPIEALEHKTFDLLVGGRNIAAVRLVTNTVDLWALRAEDPDKDVAGRIWTTEIVIGGEIGKRPHLSLRLIVNTTEPVLNIEPHVPGTVFQLARTPGLLRGGRKLGAFSRIIRTENDAHDLCDHLEDPERRLPIFVLTVPEGQDARPLLDGAEIAKATAGIARVVRVSRQMTWVLTKRFGKHRSVFDGGVRAYLPGFSSADDPYRHPLFLADRLKDPVGAKLCSAWLRRMAAEHSISTSRLGKDVLEFSAVRTAERQVRARAMAARNAPDEEFRSLAEALIDGLEKQLSDKDKEIDAYVAEVEIAEERANAAEQENRSLLFKIRQLQEVIAQGGETPTAEPPLPQNWSEFSDWLDQTFPDRIVLTPQARRMVRSPEFEDVAQVARAITWLATEQHYRRLNGGGSTRDELVETGVYNAFCGGDTYQTRWKGRRYDVDQHIKNGGNVRDPKRCLRIYYFWEPDLEQTVIDYLPSHKTTSAS